MNETVAVSRSCFGKIASSDTARGLCDYATNYTTFLKDIICNIYTLTTWILLLLLVAGGPGYA